MTLTSISSLAIQFLTSRNLLNQQSTLAQLNEQLGSGKKYSDLTDYTPSDARNLLDFQNAVTQRQAYISGMQTVQSRLSIYDSTMSDVESLASQASQLAIQSSNYDPTKVADIQATAQNYLKQMTDDLNQQVGGRYVYAGSRYSTAPVVDLSNLSTVPTVPFTPSSSPTLPDYDADYNPPTTTTSTAAYTQDTVAIDSSFNVTYGVTSNDKGFQEVIAGLRLMKAASQTTNPTTYQSYMLEASKQLSQGLLDVQATHANVAGNINTLTSETSTQNTDISNLQGEISNIQQVDLTSVGTQINLLQTQLQASYSATASIEQLSLVKYL
jgi:flagellin-like hook-associated protein FlgL